MRDKPRLDETPEPKQSTKSETMVPDPDEALLLGGDPEEFGVGAWEKATGPAEFACRPNEGIAEQSSREEVWRKQLSPEQLHRQLEYDQGAADKAARLESRDLHVSNLVLQIHEDRPGSVMYINREIVNPADRLNSLTEYDIETDKAVIQVKSGTKLEGMGTQMTISESVSDKIVIGYAPEALPGRLAQLKSQGHLVFTDSTSLISYLHTL